MKFDFNSVGTNSLRIMGNELLTPHVTNPQTLEWKILNHGANPNHVGGLQLFGRAHDSQ